MCTMKMRLLPIHVDHPHVYRRPREVSVRMDLALDAHLVHATANCLYRIRLG
jgi:hypothetical protein